MNKIKRFIFSDKTRIAFEGLLIGGSTLLFLGGVLGMMKYAETLKHTGKLLTFIDPMYCCLLPYVLLILIFFHKTSNQGFHTRNISSKIKEWAIVGLHNIPPTLILLSFTIINWNLLNYIKLAKTGEVGKGIFNNITALNIISASLLTIGLILGGILINRSDNIEKANNRLRACRCEEMSIKAVRPITTN